MANKVYKLMMERIPLSLKARILERDGHRCAKCKTAQWLEVHHIIPLYRGGSNAEANLITLCSLCHHFAPEHPLNFVKYMANPNRPPIDLALELAEKAFVTAMTLDHEDLEIARSNPQKFWETRYKEDVQAALAWLYENE